MRTIIHCVLLALIAAPGVVWAGTEGDGGDAGAKLLRPDHGTALWTLVLFLGLLFVLGKFVWPPIVAGLEARDKKIRGDIEAAEAANAKAQESLAEYEKKLAEAQAEARTLVDQARTDADALRQRLQNEAEADIAQFRQRATDDIAGAKNAAVQEIYAHAGDLAVAVAGKILERQIDAKDTQKLIDQSLEELGGLSDAG